MMRCFSHSWLPHLTLKLLAGFSILSVSVSVIACTPNTPQLSSPVAITPQPPSPGQTLPVSATTNISGKLIELEVARTVQEQAMGLMYRPSLPDNRGMLFPFNPPIAVSFWMKNVQINLDMVFIYQGKVIFIAANVPPCRSEPCPVYGPGTTIDHVIELRGGRAKELGIQVGDRITIQYLSQLGKGLKK